MKYSGAASAVKRVLHKFKRGHYLFEITTTNFCFEYKCIFGTEE